MLKIEYLQQMLIISVALSTITCAFIQKTKKYFKSSKHLIPYSLVVNIIIGLIFGSYLSHFIISTCEPDYIMFDRNVFAISYIYSILITTTFTIIVNIVTHFNLKKINMIESLKNVE